MPSLRVVSLCHDTMLNGSCLLGLNTEIQSLDLGFCRRISSETMALVFGSLPNLRHISLYSCYKLTGSCLQYLPSTLDSVDLSFCRGLDSDSLLKFIRSHPRLKSIQFSHVAALTDPVLFAIAELSQLQTLVLSSYFKEMDTGYLSVQHAHAQDITKGLKAVCGMFTLSSLDLSKNDFVDNGVLVKVSHECFNLTELNVAEMSNCDAIGLGSLGRLSQLRKLDLSGNDCVDETVLLAVAHGGALEFVNARHCPLVREKDLRRFSDSWPNRITVFQIY